MFYPSLTRQLCTTNFNSGRLFLPHLRGYGSTAFKPSAFVKWSSLAVAGPRLQTALIHAPINSSSKSYQYAGIAGLGLGLSLFGGYRIYCEPLPPLRENAATGTRTPPAPEDPLAQLGDLPPPPKSSVNLYELTFGTVCGVVSGVFVKKGLKIVAFFCGGIFFLLQYLASRSLVRVDWNRMSTRFEDMFYSADAKGVKKPPNVVSFFRWIIDFLTADFQQRASFFAGFALGIRIG